jgi:hypothetical protein
MIAEQTVAFVKECSICYDELGTTNTCTTPCGHEFCFNCMMSALNHNNTCPCCRSTLREDPQEEESDEEGEYDDDDDDDDNGYGYDLNDMIRYNVTATFNRKMENVDVNDDIATPETITKKIQDAGYTMEDVVSMFLGRIQRSKARYNNNEFVKKMVSDIKSIVDTEDNDKEDREIEMEMMGEEDLRTQARSQADVFDKFPDLDLHNLFNM